MMDRRRTSPHSTQQNLSVLIMFVATILCAHGLYQAQQQSRPPEQEARERVSWTENYSPWVNMMSSTMTNMMKGDAATKQDAARSASLCNHEERTLFSCALKGSRKMLSICGSKRLDANEGYLQYRFGRAGRVELEFPEERDKTQAAFRYTRYTRPLVTYLVVRFETKGYLYSVHQNYNAEEKPAVNEASVTVAPLKQRDAQPTEFQCRLPAQGTLMNLEEIVRRADDEEPLEP